MSPKSAFTILNRIASFIFLMLFSFSSPAIEKLDEDEGYILVAFNIEQGYIPTYVTLSGEGWGNNLRYDDIDSTTNYWIEAVSAGTYQWDRLYLAKNIYLDIEDAELTIKVEAGKISYAGHLSLYTEMNVDRDSLIGGARFYFNNKSSKAMEYLENNFSELIQQHGVIYSGQQRDNFFDYASQLKGTKL